MTKTLLALSLLFLFGCTTGSHTATKELVIPEALYGSACYTLEGKYVIFCENIEPITEKPEKHEKNCLDMQATWYKGLGCSFD